MNVNKKLLQQKLVEETGNVVLLKDLTNIASAGKHGRSRNDLDATVNTLMLRYGESGIVTLLYPVILFTFTSPACRSFS